MRRLIASCFGVFLLIGIGCTAEVVDAEDDGLFEDELAGVEEIEAAATTVEEGASAAATKAAPTGRIAGGVAKTKRINLQRPASWTLPVRNKTIVRLPRALRLPGVSAAPGSSSLVVATKDGTCSYQQRAKSPVFELSRCSSSLKHVVLHQFVYFDAEQSVDFRPSGAAFNSVKATSVGFASYGAKTLEETGCRLSAGLLGAAFAALALQAYCAPAMLAGGAGLVCTVPAGAAAILGGIGGYALAAAFSCNGVNYPAGTSVRVEEASGCSAAELASIRSDIRAACKGGGNDQFSYLVCRDAQGRCTRTGAAARLRALDARKCKEARRAEAQCRGGQDPGHAEAERHAAEAETACTACGRQ
jgi:hypothetical protein